MLINYVCTTVHRPHGFTCLVDSSPRVIPIEVENASAEFSVDPGDALAGVDRAMALSELAFRILLRGEQFTSDLLSIVEQNAHDLAAQRVKRYPVPSVFLVTKYRGRLTLNSDRQM